MVVKIFLKAAVSLTLLIAIFFMVDLKQVLAVLKQIDINYIFIALFFVILRTATGILRLFYLLRQSFNRVSLSKVIHDSLIAGFYNLFLPTALGGDVPKFFLLNLHLNDKKRVASSILLERFIGFFSLIVLALISILTIRFDIKNYNSFLSAIGVAFIIFIAVFVLMSTLSFSDPSNARRSVFVAKLISLIENLQVFKTNQICMVFIQSLIYQSLGIILVYFLGRSLGIELGIIPYFTVLPLIWFTIMIPVSISGLGIREGAFIYFFSLFDVNQELSLGLSMMSFIIGLAVGSIGGILLSKDTIFSIPVNKKE